MSVTKSDLVDGLCNELVISKNDAKSIVDDIFEELRIALESGDSVKITNFGNFEVREKSARPGRNPKTGEEVPVSARRVVTFKAGQTLKQKLTSPFLTQDEFEKEPREEVLDQEQY